MVVAALVSAAVSATTVYEAARFDGLSGKRNFDVKVVVGQQGARVEVSAGGQARVSMIETDNKLILISHAAALYVEFDGAHDGAAAPNAITWHATHRRQLALGGYCRIFESRRSDSVYREQCSVAFEQAGKTKTQIHGTRVGEFLSLVAATNDSQVLFDMAVRTLAKADLLPNFPFVVHHFEQGKMVGELRVLTVVNDAPLNKILEMPKGLRRVPADAVVASRAEP